MTHLPAGNNRLKARLSDAIAKDQVFHAYIFLSQHREAAELFAKDFIKGILTGRRLDELHQGAYDGGYDGREAALRAKIDEDRHEDVIVIRKKNNNTPIDSIRDMQIEVSNRPFGKRHIVLIVDGDDMKEETQNALLKTLEEPPGDTVLIIISENTENLLATIRSRCVICEVAEKKEEGSDEIEHAASELAELASSGAGYYKLKKSAAAVGEGREDISRLIDRTEEICRDRLFKRDDNGVPLNREKTMEDIRALEEARNRIYRGNNPKYVIKELLLKIGG